MGTPYCRGPSSCWTAPPGKVCLKEINQEVRSGGAAGWPWLRTNLWVFGLRPAPVPAPNVPGEKPAPYRCEEGVGARDCVGVRRVVRGDAKRVPDPAGRAHSGRGVLVVPPQTLPPQGGCEYSADRREPPPTPRQAGGPTPPPSC